MKSKLFNNFFRVYLILCLLILSDRSVSEDANNAYKNLEKLTEELNRFQDSGVATYEGYVHYDGYDTFSMGEHWYKKEVYESSTCSGSDPSHLQYLNIDGKRTLIGTGYICIPETYESEKNKMFDNSIVWHTHGPEWCLFPNGSTEDYRDLADALPNKLTSLDWQAVCRSEGGTPALQNVRMLHTWNWIPAPNGRFTHENFAIPFLRVGLPTPNMKFLDSHLGKKTIRVLKLAHGDTNWWYWRGFNVIAASNSQRQKGWEILQQARSQGQIIQEEMVEIGDLENSNFANIVKSGEVILNNMHNRLAEVFTKDQMDVLNSYIASLQTHEHNEHNH